MAAALRGNSVFEDVQAQADVVFGEVLRRSISDATISDASSIEGLKVVMRMLVSLTR